MLIGEKGRMRVHEKNRLLSALCCSLREPHGFTLVELVIAMAIFTTVIVGLYRVYDVQYKQQVKEYRLSESEMELGIAKNLIERDLIMAGYGIMADYHCYSGALVSAVTASDGGGVSSSDILTLTGTALGIGSRASQEWAYLVSMSSPTASGLPTFSDVDDPREKLNTGDRIIITNPSGSVNSATRTLLCPGGNWLFSYGTTSSNPISVKPTAGATVDPTSLQAGYVLYALNVSTENATDAEVPYYTVKYYLGGTNPTNCATGTQSLLRAESRTSTAPTGGDPVMSCVLDFEVALGITDSTVSPDPALAVNFPINNWDNGGQTAQAYAPSELNQRLKQIRIYILVQEGNKDLNYSWVNPDVNAADPHKIRVGELALQGGTTGRDFPITGNLVNYRWRVMTIAVTPRNIRSQ